jgi:cobalamin biosynthesis protein CobD/CbiB
MTSSATGCNPFQGAIPLAYHPVHWIGEGIRHWSNRLSLVFVNRSSSVHSGSSAPPITSCLPPCSITLRRHGTSLPAGLAGCWKSLIVAFLLRSEAERTERTPRRFACTALSAARRVLASRGWAGEKSCLFEHPTRYSHLVHNVQVIEVRPCQNGVS